MPPKYIQGYYYIHNPLLVNSLCQEESGWPPPHAHPTPPHHRRSEWYESRMPTKGEDGKKKKRIGSHSRSFQNRQVPETTHELWIPCFWFQRVTSSHHHHQNSIKIRNMLKAHFQLSGAVLALSVMRGECAVLRMRLRNYIHRIQSPVLLLLIALLSTSSSSSSGDNWLIYDRLLLCVGS